METILEQKRNPEEIIQEAETLMKYLELAESMAETPKEKSDYNEMCLKFQKLLDEVNTREDSESILSSLGISLDTPVEFKLK